MIIIALLLLLLLLRLLLFILFSCLLLHRLCDHLLLDLPFIISIINIKRRSSRTKRRRFSSTKPQPQPQPLSRLSSVSFCLLFSSVAFFIPSYFISSINPSIHRSINPSPSSITATPSYLPDPKTQEKKKKRKRTRGKQVQRKRSVLRPETQHREINK